MRITHVRTTAVVTAALVVATVSSGCESPIGRTAPGWDCEWLETTRATDGAGHTVILVDRSGSTRGRGAPDYVAALSDPIESAVETHDVVSIGTFGGSAASVRWSVKDMVTDRGRGNEQNRRVDDTNARQCLQDKLSEANMAAPTIAGSDIVGALGMGAQAMRDTRGQKKIVLATDGLATTGCADLGKVPIGDHAIIDRVGRLCQERRSERDDLRGVDVTLLGIGHPADSRPQPSTLQLDWLDALWSTLCVQSTGSTCAVSTEPVKTIDSDKPEAAAEDPVLRFPPPDEGVSQQDGSTQFQLDSEVLFTPNRSDLTAAGRQTLTSVASRIKEVGAVDVTVDGYTEAQASVAENRRLAQDRADTVRSFLVDQGVHVVAAIGHGGTAPGCAPEERQCKRRVDIVATGSS
jgi:OOP family OmpA-OmpF porin